ncbi:MAG: SpoIIE family protein phosphatase [Anaerolinea sp.]|nr:SpoIIE family protein phosphatase [Anaerolinea sp.]
MTNEAFYRDRIRQLEAELDDLTAALAQAWDQLVPFLQETPQKANSGREIAPVIEALMTAVDAPLGAIFLLPREGQPSEWVVLPDDVVFFQTLEKFLAALVNQTEPQYALQVPTHYGGLTRWVFMPLVASGEAIGAIGVGFDDATRELSALDSRMLSRMSERAAHQVIAARLEETRAREAKLMHELEIAGMIQRSIQPASEPRVPNLEIAAEWLPASNVGGDAWGWVMQPSGRLACFMVDVAGKGLPAALAAVSLHTALRLVLRLDMTPAETLQAINWEFYEPYTNADILATAMVIAIDPHTGTFEHANAGHPPTLVRNNRQWHTLPATMPPLGVLPDVLPQAQTGVLAFGDMVIVYSDGLSETEENGSGKMWGESGLLAAVPAQFDGMRCVVEAVFKGVSAHRGARAPHDDQTLMALQFLGGRS